MNRAAASCFQGFLLRLCAGGDCSLHESRFTSGFTPSLTPCRSLLPQGFLLPLCAAGDCSLREAVIVSAVLRRVSLPVLHSSAALLRIADMEYSGTNSFFIQVLLNKKYALPYRVVRLPCQVSSRDLTQADGPASALQAPAAGSQPYVWATFSCLQLPCGS